MTRDEIVAEARTYLEVPWRHRGRTRTGVDCIGLICRVGDRFGVPYEDIDGYSRSPDGRFVDHVKKFMILRRPQKIIVGAAVILRDNFQPCHIGIISEKYGQPYLIHASLAKRKVIEEGWEDYWKPRLRCVLDFPGVEEAVDG